MSAKIVGIRGMNDLLPENTRIWSAIEAKARELFELYGYEEIRTPIVENSSLFTRGLGEVTDIVEKEMYSFTDKLNGQPLTLRPENTASVIRAVIEHNLIYNEPKKYWYFGPMFRHERPQKGRYRQFYQFGVEGIGYSGIEVEAEQIFMTKRFWNLLGLQKDKSPSLSLNCIGSKNEREKFKAGIVPKIDRLSVDCPVSLAISLHAGNDSLRNDLVPINKKYPLKELLEACKRYQVRSPREFITFEIVMLRDINDSTEHAKEVAAQVLNNGIKPKFNLIPFNSYKGSKFETSSEKAIKNYKAVLQASGYTVTIRKTRGEDVLAACGQLAGEVVNRVKLNESLITNGNLKAPL